MTAENHFEEFAALFTKHGYEQPYCFSSVESGWWPIVDQLLGELKAISPEGFLIAQVKQKFGPLRMYVDPLEAATEEQVQSMNRAVRRAEEQSRQICELCGEAGSLMAHGERWKYYVVRCQPCFDAEAALRDAR